MKRVSGTIRVALGLRLRSPGTLARENNKVNGHRRWPRACAFAACSLTMLAAAQGYAPPMPETSTTPMVSNIPLTFAPPQPNQWHTLGNNHSGYPIFRGYGVGDLNGDGRLDLVLCPYYYQFQPQLPLVILVNQGGGAFADGTSTVIEGAVPTCGSPNNMFVRDFNGDGRPDVFVVDQGLEDKDANNPGFDGGFNVLLLSQSTGRLRDASVTSFPGQPRRFNHVSSVGDVNGDGAPDVVLTNLGGPRLAGSGLVLLLNDGAGRFTERSDLLPREVAERSVLLALDNLNPGASGLGDLDGDGRLDLVAASYNNPDYPSTVRTVRFYGQGAGGFFAERARMEMPAALAAIPYFAGGTVTQGRGGLGGSGVYVADFNGDGRKDVLVIWEGAGASYFQFLRNDGNFAFSDVTQGWWGGYQSHVLADGFSAAAMSVEVRDLNSDGVPDLFLRRGYIDVAGLEPSTLLYLNDGTGRFTPWRWQSNGVNASSQALRDSIAAAGPFSFLHFDADGDGVDDPVYFRYLNDFSVTPTVSRGFEVRAYRSTPPSRAGTAVKDLWWAGDSENGWGMSITQHRDTLFVVFYVYDAAGNPVWYVMPGGSWNATRNAYSGSLYHPQGAPFSSYTPSQFVVGASVGTATLSFASNTAATVNFTINGVNGSKSITRQPIATGASRARFDDLWWGGSAENGWGLNVSQQAEVLFAVWYTYDPSGTARWYVIPGGSWSNSRFTGDVYTTRTSGWLGVAYQASSLAVTAAGTMSLTFLDQDTAILGYTLQGVTQSKPLSRQPF